MTTRPNSLRSSKNLVWNITALIVVLAFSGCALWRKSTAENPKAPAAATSTTKSKSAAATKEPRLAKTVKIVLVGDSTVADQAGWGLGFRQFITDQIECTNSAQNGRSSMSFIKEGRWEKALALKADYYLIQFGHNDEPGKPGRSTEPDEYRGYMNKYVDEARAIGARPILVTSLTRRQFDKSDDHKINSSLNSRADIVREIATQKKVPLIELHNLSKALCEKMGREACYDFSPKKNDGSYDGTHLNAKGSVIFARIVVDELRRVAPELAPALRAEPVVAIPAAKETKYDATVSFDGAGTHTSVQAAIDAAPASGERPFVILVKPGVYKEHVFVPKGKTYVSLRGESGEAANTVISMATNVNTADATGKKISTRESATVLVQGDNFSAENITFENTTTKEEKVQGLAMYVEADRAIFRNCRFLGWQDTLRLDVIKNGIGRQYLVDCYIEGHVDFIYAAGTALFSRCHIHCKADGYITAASTPQENKYGFVFLDCKVTTAPEVTKGTFLGRPWRPFAATALLRTDLQGNIRPTGWDNWKKAENEQTARYSEYKSKGPGAQPDKRVAWAHQLTDAEAAEYTISSVLGGFDNWNPEAN